MCGGRWRGIISQRSELRVTSYELRVMETVFHWMAGAAVAGLLVLAAPQMVHQAVSDDGDWFSGATPDCPVWEVENSLPPTCELTIDN